VDSPIILWQRSTGKEIILNGHYDDVENHLHHRHHQDKYTSIHKDLRSNRTSTL